MALQMIEVHPFPPFVPPRMKCLIVGSFPGKEQTRGEQSEDAWFYGSPYNQLWRILEVAYGRDLKNKAAKQKLFKEVGIGIADIFKSIIRTANSSVDENLQVVEDNKDELGRILHDFRPQVLCTSRFVEKEFKKMFPGYAAVDVLPSPSPRYFKLSIADKAAVYKRKLPAVMA